MEDTDGDRTPPSPRRDWALFLDVDGTLVPHADRPDGVVMHDRVRTLIGQLTERLDGALALVSGRSLAALDTLFHPLAVRCAAGLHGVECRTGMPVVAPSGIPTPAPLSPFAERARGLAARHEGAVVEAHGPCLYLHWRAAPDAAHELTVLAEAAERALPTHRLHRGAHGIEIRPAGIDKGMAIRRLMSNAPFAGRIPVFAGDDPADEPGFAAVNALGGISVRVGGAHDTAARFALADADAVLAWLAGREAEAAI